MYTCTHPWTGQQSRIWRCLNQVLLLLLLTGQQRNICGATGRVRTACDLNYIPQMFRRETEQTLWKWRNDLCGGWVLLQEKWWIVECSERQTHDDQLVYITTHPLIERILTKLWNITARYFIMTGYTDARNYFTQDWSNCNLFGNMRAGNLARMLQT